VLKAQIWEALKRALICLPSKISIWLFETTQLSLKVSCRTCAIATTSRNVLALLRCGTDAPTSARKGGSAALRLALIVLEDEKRVRTGLKLRTHQLLIRSRVTPSTDAILRHHILGVEVANGLIPLAHATRRFKHVVAKSLTRRTQSTGSVVHHQNIGCEQDNEACDKESETHDSSLLKDFFRSLRV